MLTEELVQRWSSRILEKDPNKCWIFQGAPNDKGYCYMKIPRTRKVVACHRLSLMIKDGRWNSNPSQMACHHCDTPRCVNPNHLYWGNHESNMLDARKRNRFVPNKAPQDRENNGNSKLTSTQVEQIRLLMGAGYNNCEIAKEFNVTHQTISLIRRNKTWKIVEQ